jgi:peptidoglycan-associated lipoprotein
MIRILYFVLLLAGACSTSKSSTAQTPAAAPAPVTPAKPSPLVTWDKKMIDIGKVKQGDKRTMFFEFTNVSDKPIKIDIVDACECTKVDFPRGQIAAGAKGRLDVVFDSKEKTAGETIGINVVFENTRPDGNPYIEVVEYKFEL